jgi:4-amino-4-deoxy-L-arabinose transferase-like glycosyltransferase
VQNALFKDPDDARRWLGRLGWLAVLAIASWMYLYGIGHEPLWLDETYSYSMVQRGFIDIVRQTTRDVHPPLYYLFLKLGAVLLGTSPVALRIPSVLATLGLVALARFPVRRLFGDRTAYLFALLVALSPGFVCFAQEARMYTLAAFCVTGAIVYGRLAILEGRKADVFWFGCFTWAAAMTHNFGLVAVGVNGLYVVITARARSKNHAKGALRAVLLAALAYSPWLIPLGFQVAAVSKGFWIPPMTPKLFTFTLVAPFTYKFEDVPYPRLALVSLAFVFVATLGSLVFKSLRGSTQAYEARLQLLAVYTLTLAFGLVFSRLVQPILMPRYAMVCAGALLLVVASSIDAMTAQLDAISSDVPARPGIATAMTSVSPRAGVARCRWHDAMFLLLGGALLALGLPASFRIQRDEFNGPFRALARQVTTFTGGNASGPDIAVDTPKPVLLHVDGQTLFPAWHALPAARHVLLLPRGAAFDVSEGGVYDTRRLGATDDVSTVLKETDQVWLVDMTPTAFHLDEAKILEHPGWFRVGPEVPLDLPMSWVKVRLSYFERRP